ncbi:MAG: methionine adenosyltransferase [Actinobacteria bacterium]|nr:methionine adenosyltransferase [Actinomycetota bacterium]
MSSKRYLITSESVTEGHPDKIADQISDSILDAIYTDDPMARVAIETLVTTGLVVVAGEVTTCTYVDIPNVVRETIRNVGYTRAKFGFDCDTCGIITSIDPQSPDISQGVDCAYENRTLGIDENLDKQGAGDQGMMFGYACNETPELMPLPITLAHKLAHRLSEVRKSGAIPYLRPDGKTQITIAYEDGKPVEVETIVISTQHAPGIDIDGELRPALIEKVIEPIIPRRLIDYDKVKILINPTGRFEIGGPQGDTGLTGRKIIVDTYGGLARHGGGAFSGKDPTKVDRSGAYAARYVAKNVVAAGLTDRCEVQVAYAIGVAHPVSISVETFDTEKIPVGDIEELIGRHFDLRPAAIIDNLNLRRPIYKKTAAYGHFGRSDDDFTWERIDKAAVLREEAGIKELDEDLLTLG